MPGAALTAGKLSPLEARALGFLLSQQLTWSGSLAPLGEPADAAFLPQEAVLLLL